MELLALEVSACSSLPAITFRRCTLADAQAYNSLQLGLPNSLVIESLILVDCNLSDDQMATLVASLPKTSMLKRLVLNRNLGGPKTPRALASFLRSSSSRLQLLELTSMRDEKEPCDVTPIVLALTEIQRCRFASYSRPFLPAVQVFRLGLRREDHSHYPWNISRNEIKGDQLLLFAKAFNPACHIEQIDTGGEWIFPVSNEDYSGDTNELNSGGVGSSTQADDQLQQILSHFLLALKGGNPWLTRIFGKVPSMIRQIVDGGDTNSRQILQKVWVYLALNEIGLRKCMTRQQRKDEKLSITPLSLCWPFVLERAMQVGMRLMNDDDAITPSLTPYLSVTLLFETLRENPEWYSYRSQGWRKRRRTNSCGAI